MKSWLAVVLLLGGCDTVFGLNGVVAGPDAGVDMAIDAPASDWDGDGIADPDDNCPAIPNPRVGSAQPDLDTDGVGDACDPHPTTPGDVLVDYMLGGSSLGIVWTADQPDAWIADDGYVESPPAATQVYTLRHAAIGLKLPTIEVGFAPIDLGSPGNNNSFAALIDYGSSEAECWLNEDASDGDSWLWLGWAGGSSYARSFTPEVTTGSSLEMRLSRGASEHECTLSNGTVTIANDDPSSGIMNPAIEVRGMQVRIAYVVLYTMQ